MRYHQKLRAALLCGLSLFLAPGTALAQSGTQAAADPTRPAAVAWPNLTRPPSAYEGAPALGLALRRLGQTRRVLMIGAHPDDESTSILAALALGRGAEVAYLSLTRGEGGQNLIGSEFGTALGLLRSGELLAARRLDGANQFFTRAIDYGYSKTAAEAFRHWPRDSLLADVVAVVRKFRPDIIVSIFSGTPRDGHGHHQAAGIMARAAFEAAGDPERFPAQLARGLAPHQAARLYQARWGADDGDVPVLTGQRDPLFGRSYHQIAMASRSQHRSQGMGQEREPGPRARFLNLFATAEMADPAGRLGAFTDPPVSLADRVITAVENERARNLWLDFASEIDSIARHARSEYRAMAPAGIVPELAALTNRLPYPDAAVAGARSGTRVAGTTRFAGSRPGGITNELADEAPHRLRFHLAAEAADARAALLRAAGIEFEAWAEDARIVPGQSFEMRLTLWNGGDRAINVGSMQPGVPAGWATTPLSESMELPHATRRESGLLPPGGLLIRQFRVQVPADAPATEPYFLRGPDAADFYDWPQNPALRGRAFGTPPVRAAARVTIAGAEVVVERDAMMRVVDRVRGELHRPVFVVPAVSVELDPGVAVLPLAPGETARETATGTHATARSLAFTVRLRSEAPDGLAGTLRIRAPEGWTAEPNALPVRFTEPGAVRTLEVSVRPPADAEPGQHAVRVVFEGEDGRTYDRGYAFVDYPHIRPRVIYHEATARVAAFPVRVPADLRVGYVMGTGDTGPQALRQLGVEVEMLDAAALASGDLDRYDAIVTGARAYEVREDLVAHNRRLMDYVRRGGALIVQYNKYPFFRDGSFAPYTLTVAAPHDRVTDEDAAVTLLEPDHSILFWPNRITPADFQGWVQDKGLYFAHSWADEFTPLLSMHDPGGEPLRGGLLVAPLGDGVYVYSALAFFRQIPAGVPGAYRLLANLVSLGVKDSP